MRSSLVTAVLAAALLAPATAIAAGPGETLLASGLPGLAAPAASDFAFNISGAPLNGDDDVQSDLTPNASRVAFASFADGLVSGTEQRRYSNVLVKDRASGALIEVNPTANGSASWPSISNDGTKVAFSTTATNLVPGDTTPDPDVLVKDLVSGAYTLVTAPGTGDANCGADCQQPQLSGNGLFVAFATDVQLEPALDTNTRVDVYRRPAGGGAAQLVSRAAVAADRSSRRPTISSDGNRVAFETDAANLTSGATGGRTNVYVRVLSPATTILVSTLSGSSNAPGNGDSSDAELSGDGTVVAFGSGATNLVPGDANGEQDIFRAVLSTPVATTIASRRTDGAQANGVSYFPHVSSDGNVVSFVSQATNLGAPTRSTFVCTVSAGATAPLGPGPSAEVAALSGDGSRRLVKDGRSSAEAEAGLSILTAGSASREVVSRPSSGVPLATRLTEADGVGPRAVSADGRYVLFASASPALPGARAGENGPLDQVFRRDLRTGEVLVVSRATGAAQGGPSITQKAAISADGSRIAFITRSALDPADTDPDTDAYVHDVPTGVTTLVSRATGVDGAVAVGTSGGIDISGDGSTVAWLGTVANLGAPNAPHVYVRDLRTATTTIADRADGPAGGVAATPPTPIFADETVSLSRDGSRVAFASEAANLGDGDTDATQDVHVRDLAAGTTTLVSRRSGTGGAKSDKASTAPSMSADGRKVAFETSATNFETVPLIARQIAVRDLAAGTTAIVSRGPGAAGAVGDGFSEGPALSTDGATVAYASRSTNLGDTSGEQAILVRTLASGAQRVVGVSGRADPAETSSPAGATTPALSADGGCLAFAARGVSPVAGVSPDYGQVYERVLAGDCGTVAPPASGAGPGPGPGILVPPGGKPPVSGAPAPTITGLTLSRATFKRGPKATATAATAKAGTTLTYRLNVRATTTIAVQRRAVGRRSGSTCRKATTALRKRKACTRFETVGTLTRARQPAGKVSVAFSGRIGSRALRPARYRFSLVAAAGGKRSRPVTKAFRVVRR